MKNKSLQHYSNIIFSFQHFSNTIFSFQHYSNILFFIPTSFQHNPNTIRLHRSAARPLNATVSGYAAQWTQSAAMPLNATLSG
jgi:hypothetical protein